MLCVNLKNNRYQIIKSYNANVHLVIDQLSTCTYILKTCPDYEAAGYKHQFKVEMEILSKLNERLAPSLITCFEQEDMDCFVETYIPGINAKVWKQNYKGIVKKYILLFDVLHVLHALHSIGYLYIDLKLENIMYYKNHFYLIDFNACIENHAHVAVMASKSNCAPELLTLNEKDVRCDIYALGSLVQELFGRHMFFIVWLCHFKQKRRISKLKTFTFWIYVHIFIRIFFVLFLCFLSVFYSLKSTRNESVFDAYYHNHRIALFEKAYQESNQQERLYTWILNDWILDEVYENEQASLFLMKEAIQTKDAALIRYIYDRVSLRKYPEMQALALVYLKPDAKRIDQCVQQIQSSSLFLQDKLDIVNQCLQVAIHEEFKISLESIYQWVCSLEENQVLKYQDSFEDLGCNYLEYDLLLKKKESETMQIPILFVDHLKSERWQELYAFWRSL